MRTLYSAETPSSCAIFRSAANADPAPNAETVHPRPEPLVTVQSFHLTEMCSGSEAGSYLRLIDLVYHSTLGLRE